jgi:hypothetical protein
METLPVPEASAAGRRDEIGKIAESCSSLGPRLHEIEREGATKLATALLGSADLPSSAKAWWKLESGDFVRLAQKHADKGTSASGIVRVNEILPDLRQRRERILKQLEDAQAELNERVDCAFGLSRNERQLIARAVAS